MKNGHAYVEYYVNGSGGVAVTKEIVSAKPDHDANCVGSDACCRKCYRMVLEPE